MKNREGRLLSPRPVPHTALLHVARHYLLSFAISFLFFFVVFFINQILLLAEDILSKSAPFAQTMLLLAYSLPSVVAISFPFAALAGALMASAGLNADREILAFSAAGISTASLYVPFLILGLAASLLSFSANDYFLPRGSRAFKKLYGELVSRSAAIELTPYSVKKYSSTTIVTGNGSPDGIEDIIIFDQGEGNRGALIGASSARLAIDDTGEAATISMAGILEHKPDPDKDRFSLTTAETLEYRVALKDRIVGFSGTSPAEMSSLELRSHIERKGKALATRLGDAQRQVDGARAKLIHSYGEVLGKAAAEDKNLDQIRSVEKSVGAYAQALAAKPQDRSLMIYSLEYHKKFAIPAAGFFFSLLAFPLGLGARKAGRTAGFGVALLISTLYWGLLFAGQTAGLRSILPPEIAMWAPNLLVALGVAAAWAARIFGTRRSL